MSIACVQPAISGLVVNIKWKSAVKENIFASMGQVALGMRMNSVVIVGQQKSKLLVFSVNMLLVTSANNGSIQQTGILGFVRMGERAMSMNTGKYYCFLHRRAKIGR